MTTVRNIPGWVAAVALAAFLTCGARAGDQANNKKTRKTDTRPGVHRMEVYSGARLTVRYYPVNLSPGESSSLRDLEFTENEASYVRDLQDLKAQYVLSERYMELIRRLTQEDLYGKEITRSSVSEAVTYSPYSAGFFAPFWGYYGWGAGGGAVAASTRSVTLSLANGMGDQGKILDAMSEVLAKESTSEYAASVNRARDRAIARASYLPRVRSGTGIAEAAYEDNTPPVVVTLKDGEQVMGDELDERIKGWIIVKSKDGSRVRVRDSEVIKVEENKRKAVKPAGG